MAATATSPEEHIAAIKARQKELVEQVDAIEAEAKENHDGQIPEDQQDKYVELSTELEDLDKQEAEWLAREEQAAEFQKIRNRNIDLRKQRVTDPDAIEIVDPHKPNKPESFELPAKARRYSRLIHFRGERRGMLAEERAYRFGCWALHCISQVMPQYQFAAASTFVNDYMGAVHFEGSGGTGGGFLVPEEFGQDMILLRERRGVVRNLFRRRPMSSDTRTDPRRSGGLTAHFVGEGAAGTESSKTWDNVRLTAKDLMVLSRYSNQLSEDAVVNIGDDLAGEISYAFADKEDECGINGDGTSTYGGIVGARQALNDAAGNPTTASAGGIIIAAGNAYSEITMANFTSVVGVLPQYADGPDTAWVCHKTFYHTIMQRLELAQGGSTATEAQAGDRRPRPLFLGYPVEFSQVMPSTEANSQVCCLLGDFMLGASFGDRQQETIMFSEHAYVNSESVFERNEIAIRGTERFDINVHDVGDTSTAGPIVGLQTLNA